MRAPLRTWGVDLDSLPVWSRTFQMAALLLPTSALHEASAHSRRLLPTMGHQWVEKGGVGGALPLGFGIHYVIPLEETLGLASATVNGVRAAC